MRRFRTIAPISRDLEALSIIPTKVNKGNFWFIQTDFQCDPLPEDLPTLDVVTVRAICQFVVDLVGGNPFTHRPGEDRIWYDLFDRIDYQVRIYLGHVRLVGLRNKYVI